MRPPGSTTIDGDRSPELPGRTTMTPTDVVGAPPKEQGRSSETTGPARHGLPRKHDVAGSVDGKNTVSA